MCVCWLSSSSSFRATGPLRAPQEKEPACCSRRDSFKRRGRKMRSVSENNNISSSLPLFFFHEKAFKAWRLEEWQ